MLSLSMPQFVLIQFYFESNHLSTLCLPGQSYVAGQLYNWPVKILKFIESAVLPFCKSTAGSVYHIGYLFWELLDNLAVNDAILVNVPDKMDHVYFLQERQGQVAPYVIDLPARIDKHYRAIQHCKVGRYRRNAGYMCTTEDHSISFPCVL